MKIPTARKLPSGMWYIQLRLGGESISVTKADKKQCEKEAAYLKAEYKAGRRDKIEQSEAKSEVGQPSRTIYEICDQYIQSKSNTLSPSSLRGYQKNVKNRFQSIMQRRISEINDDEWQTIVNEEAAKCSPKYLLNSYLLIKTAISTIEKKELPKVTLPQVPPSNTAFLAPEEIKKFVPAIAKTKYAVPALLALSSMRLSEIQALDWKNIPQKPDFIHTNGSVVYGVDNQLVRKPQNKNKTSSRNIPILIPELKIALEEYRKPSGSVMPVSQNKLRDGIRRVCVQEGITVVTIHGLRHSFASLAYHLQIPEKIAMEIGGWADSGTMHKIYTHIAQSDISRYQTAMYDFYNPEESKSKNKDENS